MRRCDLGLRILKYTKYRKTPTKPPPIERGRCLIWEDYRIHIMDWEVERYLETV